MLSSHVWLIDVFYWTCDAALVCGGLCFNAVRQRQTSGWFFWAFIKKAKTITNRDRLITTDRTGSAVPRQRPGPPCYHHIDSILLETTAIQPVLSSIKLQTLTSAVNVQNKSSAELRKKLLRDVHCIRFYQMGGYWVVGWSLDHKVVRTSYFVSTFRLHI